MGQIIQADKISTPSHSSGTITLPPSLLTLGGRQYRTSTLTRLISADVTMAANTGYFVYAQIVGGVPALRISATAPSSYLSLNPTALTISPFVSNSTSAFGSFSSSINRTDSSPIGAICSTMLTEAQFQALNGTSWVLADGRSVAGSQYASTTGISTIPDLRGMILRGKNNGRSDGNQDLGGERALGNFQAEATKRPTVAFTSGSMSANATHTHNLTTNYGGAGSATGGYPPTGFNNPYSSGSNNISSSNIDHTHTITGGGDAETRPKNIAVNYFIKINP